MIFWIISKQLFARFQALLVTLWQVSSVLGKLNNSEHESNYINMGFKLHYVSRNMYNIGLYSGNPAAGYGYVKDV